MSSQPPRHPPIPTPRHDGWTIDRQKIFIRSLAMTRNVSRAAAAAGMSRESAYRLRRRAEGVALAESWDWILSLPPKPEGHGEDHALRVADLHCASLSAGKGHIGHGSHKTAPHRQPPLRAWPEYAGKSRAQLQAMIDRACGE